MKMRSKLSFLFWLMLPVLFCMLGWAGLATFHLISEQKRNFQFQGEQKRAQVVLLAKLWDEKIQIWKLEAEKWLSSSPFRQRPLSSLPTEWSFFAKVELEAGMPQKWSPFSIDSVKPRQNGTLFPHQPSAQSEVFFIQSLQNFKKQNPNLKENQTVFLRMKKDSFGLQEWMGWIFTHEKHWIVIAVDPSLLLKDFFGLFPSENTYGYLMAREGRILSHSLSHFSFSTLQASSPLRKEIQETLFSGKESSGAGRFESFNRLSVLSAYARIGNFPLVLVLEEPLWTDRRTSWQEIWVHAFLFLCFFFVLGLIVFFSYVMLQKKQIQNLRNFEKKWRIKFLAERRFMKKELREELGVAEFSGIHLLSSEAFHQPPIKPND